MNGAPPTVEEHETARALADAVEGRLNNATVPPYDELQVVGLLNVAYHSDPNRQHLDVQLQRLLASIAPEQVIVPWWRAWLLPLGAVGTLVAAVLIVGGLHSRHESTVLPLPSTALLVAESKRAQLRGDGAEENPMWGEYDNAVMDTLIARYQGARP